MKDANAPGLLFRASWEMKNANGLGLLFRASWELKNATALGNEGRERSVHLGLLCRASVLFAPCWFALCS